MLPRMVEPVVVPRAAHALSRRDIDPDALKVLYRLRQFNYVAYLVGGGVRDLLLGRRPKDFDVGTNAHPYEIKRLFRNCWIIGRRFRLAHVKFGTKVIEVATFRRPAAPEPVAPDLEAAPAPGSEILGDVDEPIEAANEGAAHVSPRGAARHERLVHRDNTFGTPEEDAFRRDFTINALFYDIATFSIIDYVGGLDDLEQRAVRCIGDPDERFQEDPVRMLRAIALAARLDFIVDRPIYAAIERHRHLMGRAAPARLLEEYLKILRSGAAERTFRDLDAAGLLEAVTPQLHGRGSPALWQSLERLDQYRRRFAGVPEALTSPVLLGSLLVPLGLMRPAGRGAEGRLATFGILPLPRRDIERLAQALALQPRLAAVDMPLRVQRSLLHRSALRDALDWLDVFGDAADVVQHWRALVAARGAQPSPQPPSLDEHGDQLPHRRRRRRRRRRGRGHQHQGDTSGPHTTHDHPQTRQHEHSHQALHVRRSRHRHR